MILLLDSIKNKHYKKEINFLKEFYCDENVVRICLDCQEKDDIFNKTAERLHLYSIIWVTNEINNILEAKPYINSLLLMGNNVLFEKNFFDKTLKDIDKIKCFFKHFIDTPGIKARIDILIKDLQNYSNKYTRSW